MKQSASILWDALVALLCLPLIAYLVMHAMTIALHDARWMVATSLEYTDAKRVN